MAALRVPVVSSSRSARIVAQKGTLEYTAAGLTLLFFYLLWGDLCLQLMELDIPQIIPLQVRAAGAANVWIGVFTATIPAIFGMTMTPVYSVWSDNTRTALGRRRPFLLVAAPAVALVLVAIGFAPELAAALGRLAPREWLAHHPATVQLGLFTLLVCLFYFFNSCLQPCYVYFVVDVVPDRYMGRFLALFRVVASLASFLFQRYLYGHALTHTREIYAGTAVLFLAGFLLMCWRVPEGAYPPPALRPNLGVRGTLRTYFRDCFSQPHYLFLFARWACFQLTFSMPYYAVFLYRDSLEISLSAIGRVNSWVALIAMAVFYPVGMICDRFQPIRYLLGAVLFNVPVPLLAFFFLRDATSFVVFGLALGVGRALLDGATQPINASILPRTQYGQFVSANQMFGFLCTTVGNIVLGLAVDWVTDYGRIADNYRYVFLWAFGFHALALVFSVLLYRSWLRHGGAQNAYVPPLPPAAPAPPALRS